MLKTRKRWISLLVTLAMLVAFAVPFAGPAAADTGLYALSVPTVADGNDQTLGTTVIRVDVPEALQNGNSVIISLPSDFRFGGDNTDQDWSEVSTNVYGVDGVSTYATIEAPQKYAGLPNALYSATATTFKVERLSDNEAKITLTANPDSSGEVAVLLIKMPQVWVDKGFKGDITLTADAPSGSGFPSGDVVVGRVGSGAVSITATSTDTGNSSFTVKLRVKETLPGDLEKSSKSIKLVLPSGYEWDDYSNTKISTITNARTIWGDSVIDKIYLNSDGDELKFDVEGTSSTKATCFEVPVTFSVSDEEEVEPGDIVATVSGDSDLSVDEITVGTYGDYSATVTAEGDIPTIFAGKAEQEIAKLLVKEAIGGSLQKDRTVLLTLPDNAVWVNAPTSVNGDVDFTAKVTNNGHTLRLTVSDETSGSAGETEIKDLQVDLQAGVAGDLVVEVSGSAGVTGEVTVAKVVTPITMTALSKPEVKIGRAAQQAGDIVITEQYAGALKDDADLSIILPTGVTFTSGVVPKVTVTEGDVSLNSGAIAVNWGVGNNILTIPIKRESTKPSTIEITGIQFTVDRTVPEGDVQVVAGGPAVVETSGTWPNSGTAAVCVNADVVTPAPGEQTGTAVFKIGDPSYTLNGVTVTMDAAPYIKADRTFVPVRFAANAVGVSDANILWDPASQKVTVIKGDRVVQMTIGSNVMLINGATITMDAAPEISNGRTMLPIRFLGQALGAEFVWDAATQTVTVNF